MSRNTRKPRAATRGSHKVDQLRGGSETTVTALEASRERARWHITLGSIRAHLDEQPSLDSRRAAARRWCAAIIAMADERGDQ